MVKIKKLTEWIAQHKPLSIVWKAHLLSSVQLLNKCTSKVARWNNYAVIYIK